MKIFKGKAFFFKSVLLHIFLVLVIAFVSLNFWENPIFDTIVNSSSATVEGSKDISLVIIDNKSLDSYRWPWPRSLYGEMIDYFNKYTNAKIIVFDFVLKTLDKERPASSDEFFFNKIKESDNFISGYMALNAAYKDKNIGNSFDSKFAEKFSIEVNNLQSKNSQGNYNSLSIPPEEYTNVQKYFGSVNLSPNPFDGVLRTSTDLINYKGKYYPSLALMAYLRANDTNKITLTNKHIIVDKTNLKIPIFTSRGDIKHNIKYYTTLENSEYSHNNWSAIDIINSYRQIKKGQKPIIEPSVFNDKIIIIGANALGLEDDLKTPISTNHPGADIQATILDNFLHNNFVTPLTFLQNILIIILLSTLTFVIILNMAFLPSLITLIFSAIVYFVLCIFAFHHNIIPLVITPLAVQLSTMIFGYSYRFILEGKNKEKIKNAMGKYLSQDIMKNVVQNIDDIKLGGKKANVTVLFADIRGFTSMSEKMTAEEVSVILNEYFSEIEPIITKYNGVINKFIGDAVMAIFGANSRY